jgi:RNA polymerase sigma-70 factor (ECF subfamily)
MLLFVHATSDELLLPLEPEGTSPAPGHRRAGAGPSDGDLVLRAKAGDRAAEEAIYRRHVRYIAGMVARLLDNRAEAEDCVQETFAIALERLGAVRDGDALRAWIARIAVSQVRRRYRKRRLLRMLGLDGGADDAVLEGSAWTGASPEVAADVARIHALLVSLPVEQRIAWSLRHVEGLSLGEVAEGCACSLATVKRRIAAADTRVRGLLEVPEEAS